MPCCDLLIWVLVAKLAPSYYRKLDWLFANMGHYHELASWQKIFKWTWRESEQKPITLPLNDTYWPDPIKWVCTGPYFVLSRFLLCKHLVQSRLPTSRRRGKINLSTKFLFLVCLHNTPMLIRKLVKFYHTIATGNTCKIACAHSPHVVRPGIRHGHSDSNAYLCPAYSMQSLVLMIFIWRYRGLLVDRKSVV